MALLATIAAVDKLPFAAAATSATAFPAGLQRYTSPMAQQLLMIEDDRRLAGMVVEYLTHSGFDVAHAADAAEGLAWLKVHTADLVLLDL